MDQSLFLDVIRDQLPSHPLGSGGYDLATYGGIVDCKLYSYPIGACHAALSSNYCPVEWTKTQTMDGVVLEPAIIDAWILFMRTGPWRSIINTTSDHVVHTLEWQQAHNCLVIDTDPPGNVMANLFITHRQVRENPDLVRRWFKLVDAGINPTLAFVFVTYTRVINGHETWGLMNLHGTTLPRNISENAIINMLRGTPTNPTNVRSKAKSYYPVSTCWYSGEGYWEIDFQRRYSEHFNGVDEYGQTSKRLVDPIKLFHKEQERLLGLI